MSRIEEKRAETVEDAWSKVQETWEGRLILWEIMAEGGLFKNPYTGNAETNFLCGKQHMAQWVLKNIDPATFGQMMKQNAEFEEQLEREEKNDEAE